MEFVSDLDEYVRNRSNIDSNDKLLNKASTKNIDNENVKPNLSVNNNNVNNNHHNHRSTNRLPASGRKRLISEHLRSQSPVLSENIRQCRSSSFSASTPTDFLKNKRNKQQSKQQEIEKLHEKMRLLGLNPEKLYYNSPNKGNNDSINDLHANSPFGGDKTTVYADVFNPTLAPDKDIETRVAKLKHENDPEKDKAENFYSRCRVPSFSEQNKIKEKLDHDHQMEYQQKLVEIVTDEAAKSKEKLRQIEKFEHELHEKELQKIHAPTIDHTNWNYSDEYDDDGGDEFDESDDDLFEGINYEADDDENDDDSDLAINQQEFSIHRSQMAALTEKYLSGLNVTDAMAKIKELVIKNMKSEEQLLARIHKNQEKIARLRAERIQLKKKLSELIIQNVTHN